MTAWTARRVFFLSRATLVAIILSHMLTRRGYEQHAGYRRRGPMGPGALHPLAGADGPRVHRARGPSPCRRLSCRARPGDAGCDLRRLPDVGWWQLGGRRGRSRGHGPQLDGGRSHRRHRARARRPQGRRGSGRGGQRSRALGTGASLRRRERRGGRGGDLRDARGPGAVPWAPARRSLDHRARHLRRWLGGFVRVPGHRCRAPVPHPPWRCSTRSPTVGLAARCSRI